MDLGLTGKVAIVTGGSRGLGLAAAVALAEEGCAVGIIARDPAAGQQALATLAECGVPVAFAAGDVGDRASAERAVAQLRAELGPIAILIYNNGGAPDAFRDEATEADHDQAYRALVLGLGWCVDAVLPDMRAAGWGRIVSVGSVCAKEPHRAPFAMVLHNIARPAQAGLAKTLACELGGDGITVNTIAVGALDHDGDARARLYRHLTTRGVVTEGLSEARMATIPVGRYGTARDLGALCAFLASREAGFITGQVITLDGGQGRSLF